MYVEKNRNETAVSRSLTPIDYPEMGITRSQNMLIHLSKMKFLLMKMPFGRNRMLLNSIFGALKQPNY
jgi:hypothetical protein